jgi:hypothetical protein
MDIVRKLLLYLEVAVDYKPLRSSDIAIGGYSDAQIGYHLGILADGGLIDVIDTNTKDSKVFSCFVKGITWQGHEFLDSVRDDGVWSQTRDKLKPVGSASLEVVKSIATTFLCNQLGLQR